MARTILAFGYLFFFLLTTVPTLFRVKRLHRLKKAEEADRISYALAHKWGRLFFQVTGSRVKVEGLENVPQDEAVLFVSNHQNLFDILLLLGYIPKGKGFISKKEIEKIPFISTWMQYLYCIFMDRQNIRQSLLAINLGIDYLKRGHSLVIFPEGTRSKDGRLLDFKPGALKLAVKSGVPIIPVTLNGTYKVFVNWRLKPVDVSLVISPPIFHEEIQGLDMNELTAKVKGVIASKL